MAGSFFDVFGKSYLAFLFCADVTTEIIGYINQGDESDRAVAVDVAGTQSVDPRVLRQQEMADIGCLRADFLHRQYVESHSSAWTTETAPPKLSREPPPLP